MYQAVVQMVISPMTPTPEMTRPLVTPSLMPGMVAQDIITILAALTILGLLLGRLSTRLWAQIVILGLLGSLFYNYGILVIERVYTPFYLVYLAIFGLVFYAFIYAMLSIDPAIIRSVQLTRRTRITSVVISLLTPAIFIPLWSLMLTNLIHHHQVPDNLYSIFILDLCFIMPFFVIVAVLTARNTGFGILLTPTLYFIGFAVLFPLALGELLKPALHMPISPRDLIPPLILSLLYLIIAVVILRKLRVVETA